MLLSATKFAEKSGLSKGFVLQCCRSEYGNYFAHPSKVDSKGKCIGKWLIDEAKFQKAWEKGLLVMEN